MFEKIIVKGMDTKIAGNRFPTLIFAPVPSIFIPMPRIKRPPVDVISVIMASVKKDFIKEEAKVIDP